MKKVMLLFLVAALILVPGLAAAQTGGAGGGTQAPASPADKPDGKGSTGGGMTPGATGGSPSASPPGAGDTMSQYQSKADCEGAGGAWTEATKTCQKK